MNGKRLIVLILAVVMVLSLVTLAFAADRYTDVSEDEWYYEAVDFVTDKGLMDGVSAAAFAPDEAATRAVLVVALYRLEGSPAADSGNPFTDVEEDGTDTLNAIVWAAGNGIVEGYGDGRFGPDDTLTREQMAAIFYRYYEYKAYDVSASAELDFSDADEVSSWALPSMQWAVGEGIVEGDGDGTVRPGDTTSRSELAELIFKAFARKVTFNTNWYLGKEEVVTVVRGRTVEQPEKPSRIGFVFAGWYTQPTGSISFDFEQPITEDTTVYAQWWLIYTPEQTIPPTDPGSTIPVPTDPPPTDTGSF